MKVSEDSDTMAMDASISQEGHATRPFPPERTKRSLGDQNQIGTDKLLRSLLTWQDEVSSKLGDLTLLGPIHQGLRSLQSEVQALRQELKKNPLEREGVSKRNGQLSADSGVNHRPGKMTTESQQQQVIQAHGCILRASEQSQATSASVPEAAVPDKGRAASIRSAGTASVEIVGVDDETGGDSQNRSQVECGTVEDAVDDDLPVIAAASSSPSNRHTRMWDSTFQSVKSNGNSYSESAMPIFTHLLSRCHIHPDSYVKTTWDVLSAVALLFDSLMIPFIIAWDPAVEGFILAGMWLTAVFWTTDVLINLNTGFFTVNGDLEYRPQKIFVRYFKSTMLIDFLICATDWVAIALEAEKANLDTDQGNGLALVRIVKVNRIIRITRVFRMSNIWEKLERFNNLFLSDTAQVFAQVAGLFLFLAWLSHLLCCVWYAIGTGGSASDTGIGWLQVIRYDDTTIQDSSMLYQYACAYHWSASLLSISSMDVFAVNSKERAYTIALLLFGLFFCSSLVSRLSSLMVQLQMANQEHTRIIKRLRTFLRQNSISVSTAQRIEKQLRAQLESKRLLSMEDIPILEKLSKPLLRDMKFDMLSHHMLCQSFFSTLGSISSKVTRVLCELLNNRRLTANEELFGKGVQTRCSYLLVSGTLLYLEDDPVELCESSFNFTDANSIQATEVKEKYSWLSSAAFWMTWTTKGFTEAKDNCEVICIDGHAVLEAVSNSGGRVSAFLRHYQKALRALWQQTNASTKVNDINDPVDHALVLLSLPRATRVEVSAPLLEVIRQKNWLRWGSAQAMKELETEVSMGKCALTSTPDGTPVRVAIVIVLRVCRPGGEVLMEVAQIENEKCKRIARYAGSKLRAHEAPREAAERSLVRLTHDLVWNVDPGSMDLQELDRVEVEWESSPKYGLRTQYRRNIFAVSQSGSNMAYPPQLQMDRHSPTPSSTGHRSSTRPSVEAASTELSVPEMLDTECPYLASHHPDHVHWATEGSKTTVFAWIREQDIASLFQLAKK